MSRFVAGTGCTLSLETVIVRKGQAMALTEYEKKILEQMEASLREEDPALASQMSSPTLDEDDNESARGPRTPRRIALGFAGAVLGMVVLVVRSLAGLLGSSRSSWAVAGFALTVAGILYALSRPGSESSDRSRVPKQKKTNESGGWDSFIQDQERRWDDRKNDD